MPKAEASAKNAIRFLCLCIQVPPVRFGHQDRVSRKTRISALFAWADSSEVIERVDPGSVTVAPVDPDGVGPDFFDVKHLQDGLIHGEQLACRGGVVGLLRFGPMRAGAGRARALIPQIAE